MNRTEFIIATAIILLLAFAMGWFTYWLLHRFTRVAGGDMGEMDRLAQSLHEAEEMRDQTITYFENREAELMNQIAQTEAELRAAMEGLRDARQEAEEMRAYIERMHGRAGHGHRIQPQRQMTAITAKGGFKWLLAEQELLQIMRLLGAEDAGQLRAAQIKVDQNRTAFGAARQGKGQIGRDKAFAATMRRRGDGDPAPALLGQSLHQFGAQHVKSGHRRFGR